MLGRGRSGGGDAIGGGGDMAKRAECRIEDMALPAVPVPFAGEGTRVSAADPSAALLPASARGVLALGASAA
ncbi:hypothetical protein GCM10010964_16970 [Caldovatus sediminis]|uniref:Uncharacterized protein n=1 Tax=Caldovatus sediminis TaxID=2041189 RepID=A0A8J3EBW6_9PROT|nr:hypothetical protein GCM10010964_16970 [Caldovatus sediminis]